MTTKNILELEKNNTNRIILHSEGMFWRAYEISAFLFCTQIKQFKPKKRYIKAVGEDVISIGFPKNEKYFEGLEVTVIDENRIEITNNYDVVNINDLKFNLWKESVSAIQPPQKTQQLPNGREPLELQIARFNLENKTPLECMHFVAKLKQEIATIN